MIGKYIILEKLSGERYRPDMFPGNREIQGFCLELPQAGYPFYLYTSPEDVKIGETVIPKEDLMCAWTSAVREVDLEKGIIKTTNSTYKIEIKNEQYI